ncbi:MAG: tetratricopeptide repeat protein [Phycisphaerae bacterium]|nr:tetratricopeptide repeat protein [Phycisphaerae bacterium]
MKRFIWLTVLLVVLGVIGLGTYSCVNRNRGTNLLKQAEAARKAGDTNKARALAERYIADHPDDERGYRDLAQTSIDATEFDRARKDIARGLEHSPTSVMLLTARAESYTSQALKQFNEDATRTSPKALREVVEKLEGASATSAEASNPLLAALLADAESGKLSATTEQIQDIHFLRSLNYVTLHRVRYFQYILALRQKRALEVSRTAQPDPNLPTVEEAQALMSQMRDSAIASLTPVAKEQPLRGRASSWLIQYIGDRWLDTSRQLRNVKNKDEEAKLQQTRLADEKHLDEIQERLLGMKPEQQPVSVICDLIGVRLGQAVQKEDERAIVKAREWAMATVETLMANRPNELEPKRIAVDLAMSENDAKRALALCDEALKVDNNDQNFRLKRIQCLLDLNRTVEAQQDIQLLRSGRGAWNVQLRMADVTQMLADQILRNAKGRPFTKEEEAEWKKQTNAARDNYRDALKSIEQTNFNELLPEQLEGLEYSLFRAYSCVVRSILSELTVLPKIKKDEEGNPYVIQPKDREFYADTAFNDADRCQRRLPKNPDALRLFVDVALMANRPDAAEAAVKRAAASNEPVTVAAAARLLAETFRNKAASDEALIRLGTLTPISRQDKVQVAESLLYLKRTGEAAKHWRGLPPESLRTPLQKALGKALVAGGQYLSASDYLSAACKADPRDLECRQALAEAYWGAQLVDSAHDEVKKVLAVDPDHDAALLLLARIRMVRGEDPSQQLEAVRDSGGLTGLALAMNQLYLGNARECSDTCDEIVHSQASDVDKYTARLIQARAKMVLGLRSDVEKLLTTLIREQPSQREAMAALAYYRRSEGQSLQNILTELVASRANPIAAHLLVAEMYLQAQDPKSAMEKLLVVVRDRTATEVQQTLARQMMAQAYTIQGKFDEALQELSTLETDPRFKKRARLLRCALLLHSKRTTDAIKALDQLRNDLEKENDYDMLLQVGEMYRKANLTSKALDVCDRAIRMIPGNAAAYVQKANIHLRDSQIELARAVLDQAMSEPALKNNPAVYIDLAKIQEHQGDPLGSAATLERMESIGDSAKLQSLLMRAELFTKYRMADRAAECLEKVLALSVSKESQFRIRLGRIYAAIDMPDKARECFSDVTPESPLYIPAQLMIVELHRDVADRAKALDVLAAERPQDPSVMQNRMLTALLTHKYQEAITIFSEFRKDLRPNQKPFGAALIALEAYCRLGDTAKTLDFTRQFNPDGTDPAWNVLTPLLASKDKPDFALSHLPADDNAELTPSQILLGMLSDNGNEAKWYARLQKLNSSDGQRIAPGYMALAARVVGDVDAAQKLLPILEQQRGWVALGARQFLNRPDSPQMRQYAKELLRMQEAHRVRLSAQTWRWGIDILKQDPGNLWAAQIMLSLRVDERMTAELTKLIGDPDTPEETLIQAQLISWQSQYKLATAKFGQAAEGMNKPAEVLLMQAKSAEAGGDVAGALELYQQVLARTFDLDAANSAAYMVTQLPAPTPRQLLQAKLWAEKVVEAAPNLAATHDTLAWVCYLLGDDDNLKQAREAMGLAISGLVNHPEAHYHMAMIELKLGNTASAKLHLEIAQALIEGRRGSAPDLTDLLQKVLTELVELK